MSTIYSVECDCGWTLTTRHLGPFRNARRRHICGDGPPCRRCGRATAKARRSRGLCHGCFVMAGATDERLDFERVSWSRDELLDEWDSLRREGYTPRQAAPRLGMSYAALDKALCRAKRDGDPRAMRSGVRLDVAS